MKNWYTGRPKYVCTLKLCNESLQSVVCTLLAVVAGHPLWQASFDPVVKKTNVCPYAENALATLSPVFPVHLEDFPLEFCIGSKIKMPCFSGDLSQHKF